MTEVGIKFKLIDLLTAPMRKLGASYKAIADKMIAQNGITNQSVKRVGNSIADLEKQIKALQNSKSKMVDENQIAKATVEIRRMQTELQRLENLPPKGFFSKLGSLKNAFGSIGASALAYFSITGISNFISSVTELTGKMQGLQNAFNIVSGSMQNGQADWNWLRQTTKNLGLDFASSAEAYKNFAGSTMGTALQGEPTRKMFADIANAASSMGLSVDAQSGVFTAMGQMLSKVKVSAEELNGQLGERMAGSLQQFAKSMGLTTQELLDRMQKGQILAENTLPQWAALMRKTYGTSGPVDTLVANQNRAATSMLFLKLKIGTVLLPVMQAYYKLLAKITTALVPLIDNLVKFAKVMVDNAVAIKAIGILLAGLVLAYTAFRINLFLTTGAMAGLTIAKKAQLLLTRLITIEQLKLNLAFLMSPVFWVVAGIAALVAGFYYLYNASEKTRGVIFGLWEVLKTIGAILLELGKAFFNVFNPIALFDNVKKIGELGRNIGSSYQQGVQKGIDSYKKSKTEKKGVSILDNILPSQNTQDTAIKDNVVNKLTTNTETETATKTGKIVTVRIDQIKVDVKANVTDKNTSMQDLGQQIANILVGAVHDAEVVIANY